jgi:hypothetical protein
VRAATLTATISVPRGVRGRVSGTIQRFVSVVPLRPARPPLQQHGRTIYVLRGALPAGIFRRIRVSITLSRTDGGFGGELARVLSVS